MDEPINTPPVSTSISASGEVCSRSGNPLFTVSITYQSVMSTTIWALFKPCAERGNGCEIRDPRRRNRRIGPTNRYLEDEGDSEIDFTQLVRLTPGDTITKEYTFRVSKEPDSLFGSDIRTLVVGTEYNLGIRRQKWRYVFEEYMPPHGTVEERKKFLMGQPAIQWAPEETVRFRFVD